MLIIPFQSIWVLDHQLSTILKSHFRVSSRRILYSAMNFSVAVNLTPWKNIFMDKNRNQGELQPNSARVFWVLHIKGMYSRVWDLRNHSLEGEGRGGWGSASKIFPFSQLPENTGSSVSVDHQLLSGCLSLGQPSFWFSLLWSKCKCGWGVTELPVTPLT